MLPRNVTEISVTRRHSIAMGNRVAQVRGNIRNPARAVFLLKVSK